MEHSSIFSVSDHQVYIITAQRNATPMPLLFGFTATWVLPASLLPQTPRLLVLASPLNETTQVILESKRFVVHLLAAHQAELMVLFGLHASSEGHKFTNTAYAPSAFGPVISGTVGYQTCELVKAIDFGERLILLGDVKGGGIESSAPPLTKRAAFASLDPQTVAALAAKHVHLGEQSRLLWKDGIEL